MEQDDWKTCGRLRNVALGYRYGPMMHFIVHFPPTMDSISKVDPLSELFKTDEEVREAYGHDEGNISVACKWWVGREKYGVFVMMGDQPSDDDLKDLVSKWNKEIGHTRSVFFRLKGWFTKTKYGHRPFATLGSWKGSFASHDFSRFTV